MADESDKLIEEAFEWIARASANDFSARERAQLDAWLNSDPSHRTAYELAEMTWDKVDQIPKSEYSPHWFDEIPRPAADSGSQLRGFLAFLRSRQLLATTGVAAAAIAAFALVRVDPRDSLEPAYYQSMVAQTTEVRLRDGSAVTLGADSKIRVVFTEKTRSITLEQGEAFFDVTPDAKRPFTVNSKWLTVTVLGTKFEVSRTASAAHVAVSDGTVSVEKATKSTGESVEVPSTVITKGQRVTGDDSGLSSVGSIEIDAISAWRRGELVYVSTPLSEILFDADRYYTGKIEIMDNSVGAMTVSLIHEAGDTNGLLDILETALPIRISRLVDGTILVTGNP